MRNKKYKNDEDEYRQSSFFVSRKIIGMVAS